MKKSGFRDGLICLLPIGTTLTVLVVYLGTFGLHRSLKSENTSHEPADLAFILKSLKDFRAQVGGDTLNKMNDAVTSSDAIAWGYTTAIGLLALLALAFVTAYLVGKTFEVWKPLRNSSTRKRWIYAIGLIGLAFLFVPLIDKAMVLFLPSHLGLLARQSKMTGQIIAVIQSQFVWTSRFSVHSIELYAFRAGYGAATALVISSAVTLLPLGGFGVRPTAPTQHEALEKDALYTAMQMRHLRALLYSGAVLLVVTTFRQNVTLRWALDYLQLPSMLEKDLALPKFLFQRLEVLVSNIVTGTGILNTLILASLYVPSAFVLQRRGEDLAATAVGDKRKEKDSYVLTKAHKDWMEQHGLSFVLKDQLPKMAAILSPLLAGPIGQLLSLAK